MPPTQPNGDDTPTRLDPPDPAQEFGAAAAEDAELADRIAEHTDGDVERAEAEFDAASTGPVSTETAPRST